MSDQTSSGLGVGASMPDDNAEPTTDQGVAVGSADVEADMRRAAGDDPEPDTDEDFLDQAGSEAATDQGTPVGSADAEQDRLRAAGDDS